MNQKEYMKQLTPKGFLHYFAGILIATYLNHEENDNKLPEDFNQELYEVIWAGILDVVRSICSKKEYVSYLLDQAIPEICKESNISDRDIDLIKAMTMFSVLMNREQQEQFAEELNLDITKFCYDRS